MGRPNGPTSLAVTPARAAYLIAKRQEERERWKRLSGPVTVRKATPEELKRK
jgi:hypothetical protein